MRAAWRSGSGAPKRLVRARVLDGRLESSAAPGAAAAAAHRRGGAGVGGRARATRWPSWRAAPRRSATTPGRARRERLAAELAQAEQAFAAVAGVLGAAREALAERRAVLDRLTVEREAALATVARLERRQEALAGRGGARSAGRLDALGRRGCREGRRRGGGSGGRGGGQIVAARRGGRRRARQPTPSPRPSKRRPRGRRALSARPPASAGRSRRRSITCGPPCATCRTSTPTCSTVAGEYPGTVSLAAAVACEAGYERALAAALAQLSGALAVPSGVDHWSLLGALQGGRHRPRAPRRAGQAAAARWLSRRRAADRQGHRSRGTTSCRRRSPTWSSSTTCAPCPTSSPASP